MTARADVLILGGGLAGLAAALRLTELGVDRWQILERDAAPGGLLKTHRAPGVTIDHLPHVFFSRDERVTALFRDLVGEVHEHRHRLGLRWRDGWLDFPFQDHLFQLPEADRRRALEGLLSRPAARRGHVDLATFALQRFGAGVVELFFRPYNQKLWQTRLERMDADWLGAKLRLPDAGDLADSVLGAPRPPAEYAPHARFLYPRRGGIQALVDGLVARLGSERLRTGEPVVAIDLRRREVQTASGRFAYERAVSTLPLDGTPALAGLARLAPIARRLRATRVTGVQFVADEIRLPPYQWIYVPDPATPYYRLTQVDHLCPDAAGGRPALLAEVAEPADARTRPGVVADRVQAALEAQGLLPRGAVRHRAAFAHTPAYPVPHRRGRDDRRRLLDALRRGGVVGAGRFGTWEFLNMDHTILSAFRAAEEVVRS
jgi:UDP-galactopyranose mutase